MNVQDILLVVLCTAAIDDAACSTYNVLQNSTRVSTRIHNTFNRHIQVFGVAFSHVRSSRNQSFATLLLLFIILL